MFPEMEVDFFTGTQVDSDIAFYFRVYFGKEVVMNSRHGGTWGEEVRSSVMTFEDGQPFELDISVLSDQYRVSVPRNIHYMGSQGSHRGTQLPLAWPPE
ncbi:Eosinophil lysophospholipase [Myotis davidii]|uniref:Galectin n=1 Tax=Myotis davidii TaxID=225400 RepID=L5MK58_MYODS|nr:Eosinophil lysophospholipase [Myotis davidii]